MKKSNPPRCDVVLLVDEETGEYGRDGRFIPEDDDVEEKVLRALRRSYQRVEVVPYTRDHEATANWLRRLNPRIVFNLTEWLDGDRRQDAAIARRLDELGYRYTGPGPEGLRRARDKARARGLAARRAVPVPASGNGRFPQIVKPRFGDASEGISRNAVVRSAPALHARVKSLQRRLKQPVLCEEFIPGRDLYVGLLGNPPRMLPPVELVVRSRDPAAPRFATYRVKNDPRYRAKWKAHYRLARLDSGMLRRLEDASRRVFDALKLRDYARLDFRVTDDGRFYFIEANPNPDLDPYALNRNGCFAGVPYDRLLKTIVESARRRKRK
jgi:D-alanine-D-alanine ligase